MLQIIKHFVSNNFFCPKNVGGDSAGITCGQADRNNNLVPTNIITDISKKSELGELVEIFSPGVAEEKNQNDNLSASDEKPTEIP